MMGCRRSCDTLHLTPASHCNTLSADAGGPLNCQAHSACGDVAWADVQCDAGSVCKRVSPMRWEVSSYAPPPLGTLLQRLLEGLARCRGRPGLAAFMSCTVCYAQLLKAAEKHTHTNAPPSPPTNRQPPQCVKDGAAAAVAVAVAASTSSAGKYPGMSSGPRKDGPARLACACVDVGLNDPTCFKGVTEYCETKEPKANITVCEAMSGFFNLQNVTAAKIASEFFVDTCALNVPAKPSACACLEVRVCVCV
jgi:hypothetical protein